MHLYLLSPKDLPISFEINTQQIKDEATYFGKKYVLIGKAPLKQVGWRSKLMVISAFVATLFSGGLALFSKEIRARWEGKSIEKVFLLAPQIVPLKDFSEA